MKMRQSSPIIWGLLIIILGTGCYHDVTGLSPSTDKSQQRPFVLEKISPERGRAYLSQLGLDAVSLQSDPNALLVIGSPEDIRKAHAVLELVDTEEEYTIENLAPVDSVRNLPTNEQFSNAISNMTIGTFAEPPVPGDRARAIIDIHNDSVIAVLPAWSRQEVMALVKSGPEEFEASKPNESSYEQGDNVDNVSGEEQRQKADVLIARTLETKAAVCVDANNPRVAPVISADQPADSNCSSSLLESQKLVESTPMEQAGFQAESHAAVTQGTHIDESNTDLKHDASSPAEKDTQTLGKPMIPDIIIPSSVKTAASPAPSRHYEVETLNDEDVSLVLNLPEELELTLLLDLAAEYLHLDYVYDLPKLKGQMVTLKLRGKLQGEITVKELYPLLESILKFKGFAMTRHEGNLVTVVPVEEVLEVDPMLMDPNDRTIKAGDIVITRMFELKHLDTFSAVNLLQNMRLTVAVSPVRETRTLIITGYAHCMARIERLLAMIDRPGKLKKVHFRQLRYITANMLAEKVKTLAAELQTARVTIEIGPQTSVQSGGALPSPLPTQKVSRPTGETASDEQTVYLDADDRTNRIVMIGYEEQLKTVEELVDAFDLPQQGLRVFRVYKLKHLEATVVKDKLIELGMITQEKSTQKTSLASTQPKPSPPFVTDVPSPPGGSLVEEPRVVVLEATNALLVNATQEQHAQIAEIIGYVDEIQPDSRTIKVYKINHIDAEEAQRKLAQLQLCGDVKGTSDSGPATPSETTTTTVKPASVPLLPESEKQDLQARIFFGQPRVVVMESTNSLLVNATAEQHAQIETVLGYLDNQTREEEIPYQVYPLENSSPSHLTEVLEKLIQETVEEDKEGKVVKAVKKREKVTIVPDPNTYSLIVYASKKNQEWIASLIRQLDKRRPQVLIDLTLVEITKTDAFNYDLNVIQGWPDLDDTSGVSGVGVEPNLLGTLVQTAGGGFKAFYGDRHIQALLDAMQSKNYGRVLAKPKLLVNDNEAGTIKTIDTTYVETKSGIPVNSGAAGAQQNFVETSVRYESYEAGITLDITPHISKGDLLLLDIALTRSDFLKTAAENKPPDTRSNEVKTAVTLPNGSTVILGGLLKMNQVKGGSKVPILGLLTCEMSFWIALTWKGPT